MCATFSIRTSLSADDLSARLRRLGDSYLYGYTYNFDNITPLYKDQNGADVDWACLLPFSHVLILLASSRDPVSEATHSVP